MEQHESIKKARNNKEKLFHHKQNLKRAGEPVTTRRSFCISTMAELSADSFFTGPHWHLLGKAEPIAFGAATKVKCMPAGVSHPAWFVSTSQVYCTTVELPPCLRSLQQYRSAFYGWPLHYGGWRWGFGPAPT